MSSVAPEIFCTHCGTHNPSDSLFCCKCGGHMVKPDAPQEALSVAPTPPAHDIPVASHPVITSSSATVGVQADKSKKERASDSLVAKAKSIAGKAWSEICRGARLTALKVKIWNLKRGALAQAHYALGKKCYELGLYEDKLTASFAAIQDRKKLIDEKYVWKNGTPDESIVQKAKRIFFNVFGRLEAIARTAKLKSLFTDHGELVPVAIEADALKLEREAVHGVERRVETLNDEYKRLAIKPGLAVVIVSKLPLSNFLRQRHEVVMRRAKWFAIAVGMVVLVSAVIEMSQSSTSAYGYRESNGFEPSSHYEPQGYVAPATSRYQAQVEKRIANRLQSEFSSNKQNLFKSFHPVGNAKAVRIHEIKVIWREGSRQQSENDVAQYIVRFTIDWQGPVTKDGFTTATLTYDMESRHFVDSGVIRSNGVSNEQVGQAALSFVNGFLEGYLNDR